MFLSIPIPKNLPSFESGCFLSPACRIVKKAVEIKSEARKKFFINILENLNKKKGRETRPKELWILIRSYILLGI